MEDSVRDGAAFSVRPATSTLFIFGPFYDSLYRRKCLITATFSLIYGQLMAE
ncbi:hypothetical protein TRIATDRAFT_297480 [Trichoderma atroviride IMI 206040]|uniref:Uncharacterized protein n=1 Tax=Hypocrea atroviridis (strain ATCC 20476 / IMI 206040) TaxID=452589 RepID=G9NI51_HYPAI|nr:uncharacterized protein TRIATDRAFT_297480 [Trichoderma atroviride IMI 206040]EHK49466.1 hypothetical protein TRIATDRAFT_297480 [Trichoderma atroviride IMI 206040]